MFKKKTLAFVKKSPVKADVENAADAKQPGDAKEDAKQPVVKKKGKGSAFFAKQAATTLAKR